MTQVCLSVESLTGNFISFLDLPLFGLPYLGCKLLLPLMPVAFVFVL